MIIVQIKKNKTAGGTWQSAPYRQRARRRSMFAVQSVRHRRRKVTALYIVLSRGLWALSQTGHCRRPAADRGRAVCPSWSQACWQSAIAAVISGWQRSRTVSIVAVSGWRGQTDWLLASDRLRTLFLFIWWRNLLNSLVVVFRNCNVSASTCQSHIDSIVRLTRMSHFRSDYTISHHEAGLSLWVDRPQGGGGLSIYNRQSPLCSAGSSLVCSKENWNLDLIAR